MALHSRCVYVHARSCAHLSGAGRPETQWWEQKTTVQGTWGYCVCSGDSEWVEEEGIGFGIEKVLK